MYAIAIDGPGGAGKSTIAKLAASKLKFKYIDTGAMYRAFAFYCMENRVDVKDDIGVGKALVTGRIHIDFADGTQHTFVNGEDVTDVIRAQTVGENASIVSEKRAVRDKFASWQREFGLKENIVMDGRDIGTVVLPEADVKIFLTADEEVRALRRYKELKEKGVNITYEEVVSQIKIRDYRDINREFSPLTQAKDAIVINTTDLDIKTVCDIIVRLMKEKMKRR